MKNINKATNNEPSQGDGKPPEDDKTKYNPKSQPGEKWFVDGLTELNVGNQQGFKPSHYQIAITLILSNLYKENPKASYSIRELIPLIASYFSYNNIKLKSNRKSIESALEVMFNKNVITALKDWRKYPKGWRVVLCYRMGTIYDLVAKATKLAERNVIQIKKAQELLMGHKPTA